MAYTADEKRAFSNNMFNIAVKLKSLKKFTPQEIPLFARLQAVHQEVKAKYDEFNPLKPMEITQPPVAALDLTKGQWESLIADAQYEVYFIYGQDELKKEYFSILDELSDLFIK